ncbi:MAG: membrane protein insertion efficiency factor YidD [Endozoicomonadaceae bacterium]|nr:membrane protein insertion efficiency factor YidD [Endozoicomonadaceae bacterium]
MFINPAKTLALLIISIYQYMISPLMSRHCRFYPSCSAYAKEAIESRGFISGSILAIKRLLRCHPWNLGGYDPVTGGMDDKQSVTSYQKSLPQLSACCCDKTTRPLKNSPEYCGSNHSFVDKTTTLPKVYNSTDLMTR